MLLFELRFVCGGVRGKRLVFAPDQRAAVRLLREHASMFGLEHERVLISRATALTVRKDAAQPPPARQARIPT